MSPQHAEAMATTTGDRTPTQARAPKVCEKAINTFGGWSMVSQYLHVLGLTPEAGPVPS